MCEFYFLQEDKRRWMYSYSDALEFITHFLFLHEYECDQEIFSYFLNS